MIDRLGLTTDAINDAFRANSDYAPLIFAFVDSLHLLQFAPCCIQIDQLRLRSIPEHYSRLLNIPEQQQEIISDGPFVVRASSRNSIVLLRNCGEQLLAKYPAAYDAIRQGVSGGLRPPVRDFDTGSPVVPLDQTEAGKFLRPFADNHRRLMQSVEAAPWRGSQPLKLFSVVRYSGAASRRVNGSELTYTAQILLTERQREAVESLGTGAADAIQGALEGTSTAVVDTCFATGFVDCGEFTSAGRDWRDKPKTTADATRYELESKLYQQFFSIQPEEKLATFYVPVHVNGTPWISFYALFREAEWEDAYWLYRSLVPQLASSVRANARAAYWEALEQVAKVALSMPGQWRERLRAINEGWRAAANVYPFPFPQLLEGDDPTPAGAESTSVFFGGRSVALVVSPAVVAWATRQVDFDPLTPSVVCKHTRAMLSDLLSYSLKRSQLLYGFLHETGNALTETGWRSALHTIDTNPDIMSGPLRNIREALQRLQRPQALIGALRAVAKAGAQDDLPWINADRAKRPLTDFVEEYRHSVEWLIDYIAGNLESLPEIRIANADVSDIETRGLATIWTEGRPGRPAPWPPRLSFPPLVGSGAGDGEDAQACWTVAALLSEPIRNAAKALRSQVRYDIQSLLLAYSVKCSEAEVEVTIANTIGAVSSAALKSVGNALTNFVGTELGLGTVSPPEVSAVPGGSVAAVRIQLHPQRLKLPQLTDREELA
jgi:hypothetical protein